MTFHDSKFFLKSMTILGAVLIGVMMIWEGSVTPEESATLQAGINSIAITVGEIVGLAAVVLGRFRAKAPLKVTT